MRQVGLIAFNFVREQRWPILVLMLSVVALNLVGLFQNRWTTNDEDVLFLFKQVAVYGVAFAVFFGASAIHNERKTRRILSVLSKSVGRGQYIAGLLCGIIFAVFMYCCAMAVTGTWILRPARFPASRVWFLMTCLNPLFATLSAIICLALPATAAFQFKSSWAVAIPVYSMLELLMKASFSEHWAPKWNLILLAAVESGLCWLAASWVFSRRDIAVAVD
jgi:ABC-type transport system involved in multi-copper enzyme maturation permease subunit